MPGSIGGTGPAFDPAVGIEPIDVSDDDWRTGFDMAFLSVVRMSRLVLHEMRKAGGGAIVNVSSFTAPEPRLTYAVSSAVRGAVTGYMKLFADRYGRENIRMNNVLPGFLDKLAPGRRGLPVRTHGAAGRARRGGGGRGVSALAGRLVHHGTEHQGRWRGQPCALDSSGCLCPRT